MRIAYCGNFAPDWSTESDIRIALESMGHEVVQLQENKARPRVIRKAALESDLLLWTSTWDDAQPLDATLDTIHELAKAGVPSAAYHLDTFWQTSRRGRAWWRNPMWQLAHVFTADGDWAKEFRLSGIHHHWLPAGVRHTAAVDGTARPEFVCDVAFCGSDGRNYHAEWPYRYELIKHLAAMCERNGWTFRNPGGKHEKVPREDMADFYASARVTVGDSLCLNQEATTYCSDRVYEATGRAGLLIMPEITFLNEHQTYGFGGVLPTYPWGNFDKLEEIIGDLLDAPEESNTVAQMCAKMTRANGTYVQRMQHILSEVIK